MSRSSHQHSTAALPRSSTRRGAVIETFASLSDDVLLDDVQIAALVGVKPTTVKSWRAKGLGPEFVYLIGRPRATVRAVRAFLADLPDRLPADRTPRGAAATSQEATAPRVTAEPHLVAASRAASRAEPPQPKRPVGRPRKQG